MNNLPVKQELFVFGSVTTETRGDAFEKQEALEGEFIGADEKTHEEQQQDNEKRRAEGMRNDPQAAFRAMHGMQQGAQGQGGLGGQGLGGLGGIGSGLFGSWL